MYKTFFGFSERPFQLVPNPAYLYLSKSHEEALAHLTYAVSHGDGFVEITGEVGTGKTTLCRVFLENLRKDIEAAYIFNPMLDAMQLLRAINDEFGIDSKGDNIKDLIDTLNEFLMDQKREGKQVILVIDEAQNLNKDVLEQLRLLSNLETNTSKLIQIILVGQPELRDMLDSRDLRQLGQRVTLSCHLSPLDFNETRDYIRHRIEVASVKPLVKFTRGACQAIYKFSRGIPRLINIACDRALLTAYGLNKHKITKSIAQASVRELLSRGDARKYNMENKGQIYTLLIVCLILFLIIFYINGNLGVSVTSPLKSVKNHTVNSVLSHKKSEKKAKPVKVYRIKNKPFKKKTGPDKILNEKDKKHKPASLTPHIDKDKSPKTVVAAKAETANNAKPDKDNITKNREIKKEKEDKTHKEVSKPPLSKKQEKKVPLKKSITDMASFLSGIKPLKSRRDAAQAVFRIWQPYALIKDYLDTIENNYDFFRLAAKQNAFSLLLIKGANISLMKKLNLPAIIEFIKPGGSKPCYLPLVGIRAGKWEFKNGNEINITGIEEIKKFWSGVAYIPWKNFYGLVGIIPRKAPSDSVIALKLLLKEIGFQGLKINMEYDVPTREAVMMIQEKHGVNVDGSVGPITKIILYNEVASLKIPHLWSFDTLSSRNDGGDS